MRHTGVSWEPWSVCQRCGFQYPLGKLVNQLGLMICTVYCIDNLDIQYRPFMIEQVLSSNNEEKVPQTPYVNFNPEDIHF